MEDKFSQFDSYLLGELSLEEKRTFEVQLQSDSIFKDDFDNYKETHSYLENKFSNEADLNKFKENIKKTSEEHFREKTQSKSKFWYLSIAASIALLIGVFFFNNTTPPTYQEYISYPSANFTVRSTQQKILLSAQQAFNQKDFTTANDLFSKLEKKEVFNNEHKLYKAFCLLELNRFKETDIILKELSIGNSAYKTKATWYLALSLLKQKKYKACKKLLQTIPQEFNEFDKVRKLIRKLPN